MPGKDFLSIRDFTPQQIRHFLHLATQLKTRPNLYRTALKGKKLAMIFEKPSLRTRVSFDVVSRSWADIRCTSARRNQSRQA